MIVPNNKSSKFCLPHGCCINIAFVMDFDIREVEWPNFLQEVAFAVVDLRMKGEAVRWNEGGPFLREGRSNDLLV